jgi:hypothetical protein
MNDVSCESGVDEVRISFGYLNQDPEWQKMSSGFRTINSTIPLYIQSLSLESGVDEVYVSFGDLNQDLESEDARSREESSHSSSSIFRTLVRACGRRHCWSFFSSIAAVIYLTPQSTSAGFYLRFDVVCGGFRPIFWSPLSARCGGGARDGARKIYVPASFHSSRLLKARWENLRYFPCFCFSWCRIYGLCRSGCCMPWVV